MLTQSFGDIGDDNINEADAVVALDFHPNGDFLATGDRGGRIVLFRELEDQGRSFWNPFFQFQSHDPEFDYLKSLDVEEKINQVRFCPSSAGKLNLLTCNDKTIKLWNVSERHSYQSNLAHQVLEGEITDISQIVLPQREEATQSELGISSSTFAGLRKTYNNAHSYHIHSLSLNVDNQTFLSADDLVINIWDIENSINCFNVFDIKPRSLEDLCVVITGSRFHPHHGHLLGFSTSRGGVHLCDLRQSSQIEVQDLILQGGSGNRFATSISSEPYVPHIPSISLYDRMEYLVPPLPDSIRRISHSYDTAVFSHLHDTLEVHHELSTVVNSISDFMFSPTGHLILARDYLNMTVWDIRNSKEPISVSPVHDYIKPLLPKLRDNDCVYDKFDICASCDGNKVFCGSYSNRFTVFDKNGHVNHQLKLPIKSSSPAHSSMAPSLETELFPNIVDDDHPSTEFSELSDDSPPSFASSLPVEIEQSFLYKFQSSVNGLVQNITNRSLDLAGPKNLEVRTDQKVLHAAWHPFKDTLAVAGHTGLFLYDI